ncbi:MAG: Glu-tRNA(Gln) amidotransferase subunit GatD [Candidatus Micrarchaeia archaeon]|jgi:glutamyl-tRNA(Gln) amidotransferase subunit D
MAPAKSKKSASAHAKAAAGAAAPGDLVKVSCSLGEQEGILLPQPTSGTMALKLPSGYNIGIRQENISAIKVVEKGAPPSSAAPKARPGAQPAKDFLSILGCGGTIASRIDYKTGAVDAAVTPQELVGMFSGISRAPLRARSLFSLSSEDMTPAHWQKAAQAVSDEIKGGALGVVLTHGTDTLSFTSAALSFMLPGLACPVILTGSQRSSDRGSSDAELNMRAALFAAQEDFSGVFVCMHENMSDDSCLLHFGAKVRKMHTSRRDAFLSINTLPAARILAPQGKAERISPLAPRRGLQGKFALDDRLNPNVALLYSYPGMKPEAISCLSKYDGVVIAGTGLGHIPANSSSDPLSASLLGEVQSLISSGIPVVIAPQTIYGRVNLNVYSTGRLMREAGVIGHLCDFTPEAAYVKLMWVLGHEKKMERVRQRMEKNLAGEISERSEAVDFGF